MADQNNIPNRGDQGDGGGQRGNGNRDLNESERIGTGTERERGTVEEPGTQPDRERERGGLDREESEPGRTGV